MAGTCLGKIRSYYSRMSEKEKQIADYILSHPEQVVHSPINAVAEDLQLAEATVFRFCKRIGYKGYQAMKIALAAEIMTPMQHIHEEIGEQDDEMTIAEKVFQSNIRTLEHTLQILDGAAMKRAVGLMLGAERIAFYGTGGSAVIAMDAYHKFIRAGVQTVVFSDSHFQLMSAAQLTERDVAVVISHSGTNQDTLRILAIAKGHGAKTIGITSFPASPLSQQVDAALHTISEETAYRSEALASRIGQLSLIDALYINIAVRNQEKAQVSLERIRDAISETRI